MILVYIFILIMLVYNMEIFKFKEYNPTPLGLKNSTAVKGIAAIVVVLHHIAQRISSSPTLILFNFVGYLSVSIFLFYSGYGLMISYNHKENYLDGFWKNRMPKIILPFILSNLLFILAYWINGIKFSIYDIFTYIIGLRLIDSFKWYVITTIILYAGFYIIFRQFKRNIAIIATFLLITCYCLGCIFIGKGSWWYNATYCFFLGILFGTYDERAFNFIKKRYYTVTPIILVFFILTFILKVLVGHVIFQMISSLLFVIIIICLLMKVNLKNKVLNFLGSISYEIYLVHGIVIRSPLRLTNPYIYLIVSISTTIILAYLFSIFSTKIVNIYTNRINKNTKILNTSMD